MRGEWSASIVRACAVLLLMTSSARADDYTVAKGSAIEFLAKITNGSFVAKSSALSGKISHEPQTGALLSGELRVVAGSFETGMAMRDRHMREKYLEADKHPSITLVIDGGSVLPQPGAQGKVQGHFVIKGKQQRVEIPIMVREVSGGRLIATSKFRVNIGDYGIEQPRFAVVKMEPVVEVTVTLVLLRGTT